MRLILRAMLRLLVGAFSVAVIVLGAGVWLNREAQQPGPLTNETVVVVPRGTTLVQIDRQLSEAGATRWPRLFLVTAALSRFSGSHEVRAGEYAFAAGASVADILEQMHRGHTVGHRLTVIEGQTVAQVLAMVRAEPVLTGDPPDHLEEGSLLPDTYLFSRGDTRAGLIHRMRSAMTATLAELWPLRTPGLPLPSPAQAVVLASIVEKETGVVAERPRIAGVFFNRLALGMRLQSDPTVIYALTGGKGPLGRPLTQADWHFASPFNTYQIDGLPPGPIGNPGRAALHAVLMPEHHDFLYFVADGSGGHAFAKTLADHNHNVAHWRAVSHP